MSRWGYLPILSRLEFLSQQPGRFKTQSLQIPVITPQMQVSMALWTHCCPRFMCLNHSPEHRIIQKAQLDLKAQLAQLDLQDL